jgi:hypothetical protein
MEKYPHELEFISRIKRDGSGTEKITEEDLEHFQNNKFSSRDKFTINSLSMSEGTFIASGFNSYIVKLKPIMPKVPDEYKNVNRLEIIDHSDKGGGRGHVYKRDFLLEDFSLQDNGKTLKIFLK